MEKPNCNLCSFTAQHPVYVSGKLRAVICSHCSLVYLFPRMNDAEYIKYYEDQYQKERHELERYEEAVERLLRKGSREKKLQRFHHLKKYITKDSDIFEVGAGMGTFLDVVREKTDANVSGIEVGRLASTVAKKYYNVPVEQMTLGDYIKNNAEKQFSLIILNHVLEHLLDPKASLHQLHTLLMPDGYLHITVPNVAAPDEPLDRFFRIPHTYYFSPRTLEHMLRVAGFTINTLDIGKQEMRVIAQKTELGTKGIDTEEMPSLYSVTNIERILKTQNTKYVILRRLKRVGNIVLPRSLFNKVRHFVVIVLRKLGIIKV